MSNYKIIKFHKIDSTNSYLKKYFDSLENKTIVMALKQSKGRGRLGRSWTSKSGKNLLFSILLKNDLLDLSKYPLLMGASVFDALNKIGINNSIKWPNDILIDGKKVCGILAEAVTLDNEIKCVIIGVGINVNQMHFSKKINTNPTSLRLELHHKFLLTDILDEVIISFNSLLEKAINGEDEFIKICQNNQFLIGKNINFTYQNSLNSGKVIGINDNGFLQVELEDKKIISLNTLEVSIKKDSSND